MDAAVLLKNRGSRIVGFRVGRCGKTGMSGWGVPRNLRLHLQNKQFLLMKVKVLVAQSCLTLCDPMDYSPPGSSVHGILQARVLEWVAIPFSEGSS